MFHKLFFCLLSTICELTLFVHRRESNLCDLYIGFSTEDVQFDEIRCFLTNDMDLLSKKIEYRHHLEDIIILVAKFELPMIDLKKENYRKLRELSSEIQNIEIRNNFINSVTYYTCSIDLQEYKSCVFEFILYKEEDNTVSWAYSQEIILNEIINSRKVRCERKCDLKIEVSNLDTIFAYLYNKCLSACPNIFTEIRNEKNLQRLRSINSSENVYINRDNLNKIKKADKSICSFVNKNYDKKNKFDVSDLNQHFLKQSKIDINGHVDEKNKNKFEIKPFSNLKIDNKNPKKQINSSLKYYHYGIIVLSIVVSAGFYLKYKC
ncbi:putative SP-containing membrane protein [Vairimorpha necatrix]|uniref:SP-containing membrane protein n=1 Tax=Vairimorpha necatrix TaxID=6039 RepID=A0AAX4JB65_9MICR